MIGPRFFPEALEEYEAAALYYETCQDGGIVTFVSTIASFDVGKVNSRAVRPWMPEFGLAALFGLMLFGCAAVLAIDRSFGVKHLLRGRAPLRMNSWLMLFGVLIAIVLMVRGCASV